MKDKPRVGLIGCGLWGRNIARNLNDMGVLMMVCDRDLKRLDEMVELYPQVAWFTGCDNALQAPLALDAVVIATDAESHYAIAREALRSGLDVLVEKPLATTLEDARALVSLVDKQILMVGHVFLYNLAVHKLKELMLGIGPIKYIYSQRLATFPPRPDVGVLLDLAVHDVSILQYLMDDPGVMGGIHAPDFTDNGWEDFASFSLWFGKRRGVLAHVDVSWMYPYKVRQMVVVGERQTLVWNDMAREFKIEVHEAGLRSLIALPDVEPLRAELEHFVACCQNRTQPLTDGESAIKVLEVLLQ